MGYFINKITMKIIQTAYAAIRKININWHSNQYNNFNFCFSSLCFPKHDYRILKTSCRNHASWLSFDTCVALTDPLIWIITLLNNISTQITGAMHIVNYSLFPKCFDHFSLLTVSVSTCLNHALRVQVLHTGCFLTLYDQFQLVSWLLHDYNTKCKPYR